MAIFEMTLPHGAATRRSHRTMIVSAEDEAGAREACQARFGGDTSAWSAVTANTLASQTVNTANALVGWRFRVWVSGQAAGEGPAEVTGDATTDLLDEVGTALATAINAEYAAIANAAYVTATQTLTVATGAGGDDQGDQKVIVEIFPPVITAGGEQVNQDVSQSGIVSSITDEGVATDPLTVVFQADAHVLPEVLFIPSGG